MEYRNLELIDPTTIERVADGIELILAVNKFNISKTKLKSYIEKSLGTEPKDSFADEVFSELRRRSELYGESKPFLIENGLLTSVINWRKRPEYVLCLIFSIFGNPNDKKGRSVKDGALFERLSEEVIRGYLNSEVINFNHPNKKKIKDISERLSEKFKKEIPKRRQDRGLDLITWNPFGDKRPSQLVILFQCSAGDNWRNKLLELNLNAWKKYIDFGEYILKGFCFPKVMPFDEEEYNEIAVDAGIIIDRIRIFRCICNIKMDQNFKKELIDWCKNKLDYYNNL